MNESKSLESRLKLLLNESNQGKHEAVTNLTHGMIRTESFNRSLFFNENEHCLFKDTTQSYCYSSEDELEQVERKENEHERYERTLIREHLNKSQEINRMNIV